MTTIPATAHAAVEQYGDAEALVDGERRWSFREVVDEAHRYARALIASGVQPGDRVAVWGHNHAEWVFTSTAIYLAGGVMVPLNTRFKGSEAKFILERSEAHLLFTVNGFLDTDYAGMVDAVGRPATLQEIVILDGPTPASCTPLATFLERATGVDIAEVEAREAALTDDTMSDILFTSGTTGAPKGAMLRHGASVKAYGAWADVVGLSHADRYLIVNPFFHAFGLKAGILACFITGATMVPHAVFDVPMMMKRIVEERITMLPGPPAIYQTMLDHPDLASFDLSTLKRAVTGAATVPVEMVRRMYSDMGLEIITTGYGLTEATGIVTMCRYDDDVETIAGTCGRAMPDTEIRIVDENNKEVPIGETGEVVTRGYNTMIGYYQDPEATAEVIDADGWLHTGDVGNVDERGNLRITDRVKDMFIVGGFNAYPAEIEKIMSGHVGISQVAVIGVPDHRMGEVGKAFVVPRTPGSLDADGVIAWCREHMANYKVPRYVEIVDALPLNASGKVLKYELRRA
ncbi:MAG: FadD3 family acyl-CoA ligase [Acidimicrobiia bacterium]